MPRPIALFRHYPTEGPAYFGDFLDGEAYPWQLVALDEGMPVPLATHKLGIARRQARRTDRLAYLMSHNIRHTDIARRQINHLPHSREIQSARAIIRLVRCAGQTP